MPDTTDNAKLVERLRETTGQMARRASVDMDLWNEHSNAVLEAATALASANALNERLVAELKAATGYLLNAKIDLETGAPKKTAIQTIDGGLKRVRALLADMGKGDENG